MVKKMAKVYANLIIHGVMTLDEVPKKYRKATEEELAIRQAKAHEVGEETVEI